MGRTLLIVGGVTMATLVILLGVLYYFAPSIGRPFFWTDYDLCKETKTEHDCQWMPVVAVCRYWGLWSKQLRFRVTIFNECMNI